MYNILVKQISFNADSPLEGLDKEDIAQLKELLARPIVIEHTSKRHKATILVGILFIFFGSIFSVISLVSGNIPALLIALIGVGFGFLLFLWGTFLAWWNHG